MKEQEIETRALDFLKRKYPKIISFRIYIGIEKTDQYTEQYKEYGMAVAYSWYVPDVEYIELEDGTPQRILKGKKKTKGRSAFTVLLMKGNYIDIDYAPFHQIENI